MAAELLERLIAGAGGIHLELLLREKLLEGVPDGLLVVDHEDLDGTRQLGHSGLLG